MSNILFWAYLVLSVVAVTWAFLLTLGAWEYRRFAISRVRKPPQAQAYGRARVLAPCKGIDFGMAGNLRPLFEQDYGDYELVFIVESEEDRACETIERLIAEYPHIDARLLISGQSNETGQKVHNLRQATVDLPPEIEFLAFVDSDARPAPDWLRLLITRLDRPNTGATTGYRWFVPAKPTPGNLMLYSINCCIAGLLGPGGLNLVWGGSWVIRADVFDAIGLHDAWDGTLSDDLVASRVLHRARMRVEFEPLCLVASPLDLNLSEAFSFLRRQYVIGRFYAPLYWNISLIVMTISNAALFCSLAALAIWGASGSAWVLSPIANIAALWGLSWLRAWMRQDLGRRRFPELKAELAKPRRWDLWGAPLFGLMSWAGMLVAACGTCVSWRGLRYRIFPGGQIQLLYRQTEQAAGQSSAAAQSMPFDHLRFHAQRRRREAACEQPLD